LKGIVELGDAPRLDWPFEGKIGVKLLTPSTDVLIWHVHIVLELECAPLPLFVESAASAPAALKRVQGIVPLKHRALLDWDEDVAGVPADTIRRAIRWK